MPTDRVIFLLDSGAFTIWKKSQMDIEEVRLRERIEAELKVLKTKKAVANKLDLPYGKVLSLLSVNVDQRIVLSEYAKFVIEHRRFFRGGAFNLDEIGSGEKSYDNWKALRDMGAQTIPIYHIGTDEKFLERYLEETDYIGLGAISKLSTNERLHGLDHIWKKYLLNKDGSARVKVHGLGLTSIGIVIRYPWYSVDSSMAASIAIYGSVLTPVYSAGGWRYTDFYTMPVSNQAIHTSSKVPSIAAKRSRAVWHMRATPGKGFDNFYEMPPMLKARYTELFAEAGFTADPTVEGQLLNPLMASRKKQRAGQSATTLPLDVFDAEERQLPGGDANDVTNLSRRWEARFGFNLYLLNNLLSELHASGNHVRWYNVCVSGILDEFVRWSFGKPRYTLASYAYLIGQRNKETAFLKKVKRYASGSDQTGGGSVTGSTGDGEEGALRAG